MSKEISFSFLFAYKKVLLQSKGMAPRKDEATQDISTLKRQRLSARRLNEKLSKAGGYSDVLKSVSYQTLSD